MQISEINPFLRDAEMQLSILEGKSYRAAYDYRIFYVLGGNARILFQGESYAVSGGDLVFFRPGVPYTWAGKCRGIVLNFDLTQNQKDQKQPICPPVLSRFERERIFENDPPDLLAKSRCTGLGHFKGTALRTVGTDSAAGSERTPGQPDHCLYSSELYRGNHQPGNCRLCWV